MRPLPLILALVLALTLPAVAQVALNPQEPGEASIVDPNVAGVSPHAVSLRVIDPGNALLARSRFFDRRPGESAWNPYNAPTLDGAGLGISHRYVYRAPGVQAYVRRPQWLVTRRGAAPVAGPDTVYNLIPDDGSDRGQEEVVDDRYDPRLGRSPDARVDLRVLSADDMLQGRRPWPKVNEPIRSVPASIPRYRQSRPNEPPVPAPEPAATRPTTDDVPPAATQPADPPPAPPAPAAP